MGGSNTTAPNSFNVVTRRMAVIWAWVTKYEIDKKREGNRNAWISLLIEFRGVGRKVAASLAQMLRGIQMSLVVCLMGCSHKAGLTLIRDSCILFRHMYG